MYAESFRKSWKEDLLASLVVFLVALPLSMGIAIASGIPMEMAAPIGIVTAIIGGIVCGPLSGCPLQVRGPAAGLAVMVALFIGEYGFETLGLIVLIAGSVQLLAGFMGLGQLFRAVSPALIQGMLAGIGVTIFASQCHIMLDYAPPGTGKDFGGMINLLSLPQAVLSAVGNIPNQSAALIGLSTIASWLLWIRFASKKLRLIPAPLMSVMVATVIATLLALPVKLIPTPEDLSAAINWPSSIWLDSLTHRSIWLAGISLAFVASAESLLTATAVDSMQRRTPRTQYNRELMAEGFGNVVCGILGVLPVTGVIVRSTANVNAGARTRLSGVLHGVWLLLFVVVMPSVLAHIPVAALAAILVFTGIKLTKFQFAKILWRQDKGEAAIYLATLGSVVVVDLFTGIAVGIVLALAKLMYSFSHLDIEVIEEPDNGQTFIYLKGAASFMRLPILADVLEKLPAKTHVHILIRDLNFIDHACLDLLVNFEQQHQAAGGVLVFDWAALHSVFQRHAWGANGKPPLV
ncbi:MAG: SulP family inorganic anion transporter [Methylomonas sp.]|nr:MAG: SulP family inorganic anion transporter [Methylomonas sp.]